MDSSHCSPLSFSLSLSVQASRKTPPTSCRITILCCPLQLISEFGSLYSTMKLVPALVYLVLARLLCCGTARSALKNPRVLSKKIVSSRSNIKQNIETTKILRPQGSSVYKAKKRFWSFRLLYMLRSYWISLIDPSGIDNLSRTREINVRGSNLAQIFRGRYICNVIISLISYFTMKC